MSLQNLIRESISKNLVKTTSRRVIHKLVESAQVPRNKDWNKLMKNIKVGDGPWDIIALNSGKVVFQQTNIQSRSAVPAAFAHMKKLIRFGTIRVENHKGRIVYSTDVSEGVLKEAFSKLDFLIDQLSNSMEYYDEKTFASHISKQTSYPKDILKKMFKAYWNLSPQDRLKWGKTEWIGWIREFGLHEAVNDAASDTVNEALYDTAKKRLAFLKKRGNIVTFKKPVQTTSGLKKQILINGLEKSRKTGKYQLNGRAYDTNWFDSLEDLIAAVDWDAMENMMHGESVNEADITERNAELELDKAVRKFVARKDSQKYSDNYFDLMHIINDHQKKMEETEKEFAKLIKKTIPKKIQKRDYKFLYQIKTQKSIINKVIDRKQSLLDLSDLIRGALLFKTQQQVHEYVQNFRRKYSKYITGYELKEKGNDPKYGYYGVHHIDLFINGFNVEFQVATQKLWKYKMAAHDLYTKWRTTPKGMPKIDQQLSKKLFNIGNLGEDVTSDDKTKILELVLESHQ